MFALYFVLQVSVSIFFAWFGQRRNWQPSSSFLLSLLASVAIAAFYTLATW